MIRLILTALLAIMFTGCNGVVVVPPQMAPRQDYTLECENHFYDECSLDQWWGGGEL